MPDHTSAAAVESHVRAFFAGHPVRSTAPDPGSGLRILAAGPGPRGGGWSYLTAGCGAVEFVLCGAADDPRFAELLGMVASYHAAHRLDVEHSLPIGEPWLPGSACDHLLVSLPYLHGPELEHCPLPDGGHARVLWLLPITAAEAAFRRAHGHEALERLFDGHGIEPLDPRRPSVA
ncbi:suppressor of fused domain protein [Kitasatospora sp. NRRL B-11411]|uniref:suppressor of fused domain protein n=1 Tax=Kitasatospora sp. NRRL B-11411 TaxID=1463822 RepID=UPI0004C460EB|nr:suppressor of fused domain protein [Kitasatospora sp. NRRL B-11411]